MIWASFDMENSHEAQPNPTRGPRDPLIFMVRIEKWEPMHIISPARSGSTNKWRFKNLGPGLGKKDKPNGQAQAGPRLRTKLLIS